jgi:hypothetical protein
MVLWKLPYTDQLWHKSETIVEILTDLVMSGKYQSVTNGGLSAIV